MNQRKAKEIKQMIDPSNPISRRVYRRLKKAYSKTPENKRSDFLDAARILLQQSKESLEQEKSGGALDQED
jgi:hypothetical protein